MVFNPSTEIVLLSSTLGISSAGSFSVSKLKLDNVKNNPTNIKNAKIIFFI